MSKIFIISAPSGCGKTSLVRELCLSFSFLEQSISYTTREKRDGEISDIDYFFIDEVSFKKKITNNDFLEYQKVYNNYYGTCAKSVQKILDSNKDAILEIDYKGMLSIKKILPEAISIYILPPSIEELEKRLVQRNLDSDDVILNRVSQAKNELAYKRFSDHIIINDNFEEASRNLKKLILSYKFKKNYSIRKILDNNQS